MRWLCIAVLSVFIALTTGREAFAGTTGGLRGRLTDTAAGTAIAGVRVTVSSPSQSASVLSAADGSFVFLSLSPDTYTLSVAPNGYDVVSQAGINVAADQVQSVPLAVVRTLRTIGRATSRSAANLVKPGTTSDVYTVTPAAQSVEAALGGAGALNQAYGALASTPGVQLQLGQQGYGQLFAVRGGSYNDAATEVDGIPVQRASEGFAATPLTTLGQQELQIYTGGAPASADASGLSGYINQVIRTGTNPGFSNAEIGIGGPAFYHKLSFEYGGATANRNFSYYIGAAGVGQDYRYIDQFNGAGDPRFVDPLAIPTNNGHVYDGSGPAFFSPGLSYGQTHVDDRELVGNFHLAIPHRGGQGKDDVQFLVVNSEIYTGFYSSINDLGGLGYVSNALGYTPSYVDNQVYLGQLLKPLTGSEALTNNAFPSSPGGRAYQSAINAGQPEGASNGVSIVKLQYQRNINDTSYLRVYGYSNYSNWFYSGPVTANIVYGGIPLDYEVQDHTYGANVRYENQLNARNLLTLTAAYQTQKELVYNLGFPSSVTSNLVDARGNCYDPGSGGYASCYASTLSGLPASLAVPAGPAATNGAAYAVTNTGYTGASNTVTPFFTAYSLTDQFRPTDKLTINAGVRLENYLYRLTDVSSSYPARAFWFNAFNNDFCSVPGQNGALSAATIDPATGASTCAAGASPNFRNIVPHSVAYSEIQPRVGTTYALSPDAVLRASYGRYAQQPGTSTQEVNTLSQDLPTYMTTFYGFGFTTPYHPTRPSISNSYDFSLEKHFRGTDMAFKISPFYRSTQDEIQATPIGTQGVAVGLNTGHARVYGTEFQFSKGDFARNGLAVQLSYAFTMAKTRFNDITPGTNYIDTLNAAVEQYNSYTSACTRANAALCGTFGTTHAVPTFTNACTVSAACPTGTVTVANPYYGAAAQPLFDRNGEYPSFDTLPATLNGAGARVVPTEISAVINYRHGKLTLTPTLAYNSGATYGSPLVWPGYDPATCTGVLAGLTANPQKCAGFLLAPEAYTGKFDGLGTFRDPTRFTLNFQVGYDVTPRVRTTLTMTGLIDRCYQRGYAWDDPNFCVYSTTGGFAAPVGNFVQPLTSAPLPLRYPYGLGGSGATNGFIGTKTPFGIFANLQIRT